MARFKSNLIEIIDGMRAQIQNGHQNPVLKAMGERIRDHVVERGRLNAPILTEHLRDHLAADVTVTKTALVVECGTDVFIPYAMKWHEQPFNLGPVSRVQPMTAEGGVGNKYFTRVLDHNSDLYAAWISESISAWLDDE